MTQPRLDKNAPGLGTIYPPYNGAQYVLNGHYFSAQGEYLFSDEGAAPVAGEKAGAATPAPAVTPEAKSPTASVNPADVNLDAWFRGEAKYPFYAVKKAVLELLPDADVSNGATIKAALKEAGLVDEAKA